MNRTRYQKYIGWYSQLSDNEKIRLDNVCNNILLIASDGLEQLDEKTNIAKPIIGSENLLSFYRGEQKKAIDQALEILSTERNGLSTLFGYIVHEVKSGETDISELQPMPGRNITPPEEPLGPNSYKWAEKAAEVLSYLLYAVQIEAIIYEGIFDGTRRRIEAPKDASNEILYLLTRQVIISVGGMEETLHLKQPEENSSPQKRLFTFKGKHKPKQRNAFRRGLIEEGFIADISEGDFEYWFSEKPIYNDRPRINFLTHANHATYMLRELVDDYENPKLNKHVIANLCLSFPNDPNTKIDSNTYPTESRKYINKFNKIFNRTT